MANFLASETIETLRRAWERGESLRLAARTAGINRNTANKYFALWSRDGSIVDPIGPKRENRAMMADPNTSDLSIHIQPDYKRQLIEGAAARNTSLNHFVGFLLEVICEDGLIPAIMEETGDDAIPVAQPVKRLCLCCNGAFFSAHKYNRLCRECTVVSGDGPGDPAVDYVSNGHAIVEYGVTGSGRMGGFVK